MRLLYETPILVEFKKESSTVVAGKREWEGSVRREQSFSSALREELQSEVAGMVTTAWITQSNGLST